MANPDLRSILLRIQDRLSDKDRESLHFFLSDDVPRGIRDDPTLKGTFNLMQSLFDQGKITEQDFTLLINAFKQIGCIDAVKLLEEHKKRIQSSWLNQPTLTPIEPPLNELVEQDQEDKSGTRSFLNRTNNSPKYQQIINSIDANITPVTITVDNKTILSPQSEQNQPFYVSFRINKYFFFLILLLMIVFGILTIIFIVKRNGTNQPNFTIIHDGILEELKQKNKTIQLLNQHISEKNKTIEHLNNQLKCQEKDKDNPFIKAGHQFGGTGGDYFDDSVHRDFTCSHYLNGIYARDNNDGLESYQFSYLSSHDDESQIESKIHGKQISKFKKKFEFEKDDKINRVQGRIISENIISPNGTNLTMFIITGIQFFTTRGRASPSYHGRLGERFTEKVDGYTLGYVTGRSAQYIEQLQFFWYRTIETD